MARLKFIRIFDDGQESLDVVECNHYSINSRANGTHEITAYPGLTNEEGVSYQVSNTHHLGHPSCYIEASDSGKTIGHYRATDSASDFQFDS